jgi:hypothetical protein
MVSKHRVLVENGKIVEVELEGEEGVPGPGEVQLDEMPVGGQFLVLVRNAEES